MKLLFTDLDGTLLDQDKKIPDTNKKAIARAAQKGHKTIIATGRSLDSALPYLEELAKLQEECFAIVYNGGLIYDYKKKQAIFQKTLPLSYVKYIFQQAQNFQLHCHTYENGCVLAPRDCKEVQKYSQNSRMPVKIVPDPTAYLTREPFKVLTISFEKNGVHEAYRRSMEEWAKDKISMFFSSDFYLEHVPKGVDKGWAVGRLCRLLSAPFSDTIAAGDAENDISMLKAVKTGVCMANGSPQARASSVYVTQRDNNQGGVAEIIEKFIENK